MILLFGLSVWIHFVFILVLGVLLHIYLLGDILREPFQSGSAAQGSGSNSLYLGSAYQGGGSSECISIPLTYPFTQGNCPQLSAQMLTARNDIQTYTANGRIESLLAAKQMLCAIQPYYDSLNCSSYVVPPTPPPPPPPSSSIATGTFNSGANTITTSTNMTAYINKNDSVYLGSGADVQGPYSVKSVSPTTITTYITNSYNTITNAPIQWYTFTGVSITPITQMNPDKTPIIGKINPGSTYLITDNSTFLPANLSIGDLLYVRTTTCMPNDIDNGDGTCTFLECNAYETDDGNGSCVVQGCGYTTIPPGMFDTNGNMSMFSMNIILSYEWSYEIRPSGLPNQNNLIYIGPYAYSYKTGGGWGWWQTETTRAPPGTQLWFTPSIIVRDKDNNDGTCSTHVVYGSCNGLDGKDIASAAAGAMRIGIPGMTLGQIYANYPGSTERSIIPISSDTDTGNNKCSTPLYVESSGIFNIGTQLHYNKPIITHSVIYKKNIRDNRTTYIKSTTKNRAKIYSKDTGPFMVTMSPSTNTIQIESTAANDLLSTGTFSGPTSITGTLYRPAYTTTTMPCPAGSYCPVYSPTISITCRAGSYCPVNVTEPVDCPAGTYCPTPAISIPCPAGTYSSSTKQTSSSTCLPCPNGTYSSTTGNRSQASCNTCTSGTYCPYGSIVMGPCPAGGYCPTPSIYTPCPAGTYSSSIGQTTPSTCIACSLQNVCPTGSTTPSICIAGYYCQNNQYYVCPAGSYCVQGSTNPTPCSLGSYCPDGSSTMLPCPAGSYCPTPAISTPCPRGTSNPLSGQTSISACI